jgi:translocator protein
MEPYLVPGIFTALTVSAASTGAAFGPGPWYISLKKPWWTPPGWVFPIVWTILYVMIAIAGYKVWQSDGVGLVLAVWGVQLVFNGAWSWIMFGRKQIALALADAGAMWIAIVAFIALAYPVHETAALLFVPYLIWATIAFTLNYQVLQMNPGK